MWVTRAAKDKKKKTVLASHKRRGSVQKSQRQEDQAEQEDGKQEVSLLIRNRGGKVIGGSPTHTDMTWMSVIDVEAQAAKKKKRAHGIHSMDHH